MKPLDLTIGVTGLNATDNPGPGVAVIRALRQDPNFSGRIVGLAYDALDPGLYMPGLLDAAFLLPYPSIGRDALFARLAHIQQTTGIDILIPTLDAELPALIGQEDRLAELGIKAFLPTAEQFDRRSKAKLAELKDTHDIPVPKCEILFSVDPIYTIHERFAFPVVVKSVFYGAKIAHTVDEAVRAFHQAVAKWGLPVIVQQYVRGEEYNVAAVGDGEGGLLGAVAMKKLMLTDQGKGWAGVTVGNKPLLQLAQDVISALKWRGPCEVEVMQGEDGQLYLLEINPRCPAWIDLTAGAGQNLPMLVAQLAAGRSVEPLPPYKIGTAFVRISLNQIVDISALESISTLGESHLEAKP